MLFFVAGLRMVSHSDGVILSFARARAFSSKVWLILFAVVDGKQARGDSPLSHEL